MNKQKIACFIVVLSFMLAMPLNVFAWTKSPTTSTFSPTSWSISTTNSGTKVTHKIYNMYYSASRIASMIDRSGQARYYPYIGYEPGMDIKENSQTNNLLDASSYTSNYPNPKYDMESNSGMPYKDEVDVVSVRMYQTPMSASTAYYFSGIYTKKKTGSTGFDVNSEESVAGVSDYNVNRYEFINQVTGFSISSLTSSLPTSTSDISLLPSDNNTKVLIQSAVNTNGDSVKIKAKEFGTYRLEIEEKNSESYNVFVNPDPEKLDSYVRDSKSLAKKLNVEKAKNVPVTITFNSPLSQEKLLAILDGVDFIPREFYGRGVSGNERHTYAGLIESLSEINEVTKDCTSGEDYDVRGVIALYGTINSKDVKAIQDNSEVYLADVTGYNGKTQAFESLHAKPGAEMKVIAHNLYWYIEDLSKL